MSSRKVFISLKRGLSQDPKHRERIGNRIWLFMHIIDRADWETGIVHDWKDRDEADDMGIAWRTLQKQRQELEKMEYIACRKRRTGQDIVIYNWTNPRNYSGEVLNPRPGSTQKSVHESTPESTQKSTQTSYSGLGTPSLDSESTGHTSEAASAPDPAERKALFEAIALACSVDVSINGNGASVNKVTTALLKASPPYSAAEVKLWSSLQTWRTTPPTVWQLKQQVGQVRQSLPDAPAAAPKGKVTADAKSKALRRFRDEQK